MKDAVLTVRLPSATRRRLEVLARREGRSLSAQVERLIEQGTAEEEPGRRNRRPLGARSLAGALRGGRVPTLAEFREVRALLSTSLLRRTRADAEPGR
jgi:hypothetical protein